MPKKILTWGMVGFAVFYVLSSPTEAAEALRGLFGSLEGVADSLSTFFTTLIGAS